RRRHRARPAPRPRVADLPVRPDVGLSREGRRHRRIRTDRQLLMTAGAVVGVSLKMYFGHREARAWFARVAELVARHPAIVDGSVEFLLIPTYLQIESAFEAFDGTGAIIGAQDAAAEDSGAFTGEVS